MSTATWSTWTHLTLSSGNYGSVFYLTTGFPRPARDRRAHRVLFLLGRTYVANDLPMNSRSARSSCRTTGTLVDVVWIALFTTIYLIH